MARRELNALEHAVFYDYAKPLQPFVETVYRRAMLTVADFATDADDCRDLLAVLGLTSPGASR